MKAEFCARINQAWGGTLVREIKFVSKPGPKRVSRELDNEHTPFVRKTQQLAVSRPIGTCLFHGRIFHRCSPTGRGGT